MIDRVSLVIASYRRGAKIGPTLESVLAQTRLPDEIVVLNDGGFAETREFITANFPSVRVVDDFGGSAGKARNLGAKHATQPLIMFLDDDDRLHPHALATLLATLRSFPEAKAAFADHTFTDHTTGQHLPDHHRSVPSFHRLAWSTPRAMIADARLYDRNLYRPMLRGGLLQQPWLVEREVFLALGGFDKRYRCHEDWDLYLRLVRSHPVALTDRIISDHVVETGREHVSRSRDLEANSAAIIREHLRLAWRSLDIRSILVLRRRLALHHKSEGDRLACESLHAGWREYWRSLRCWPFDSVVMVRTLVLWPCQMLMGHHRDASTNTGSPQG